MRKLFSFIATSAILLNSVLTPVSVLAQDVPSPTPEATIAPAEMPTVTPDATPLETPTSTPIATPVVNDLITPALTTPTEFVSKEVLPEETEPKVAESSATLVVSDVQPVEKVYLSDGQTVTDTLSSEWNIDENTAETKEPVKLGVKYIFPLENKVTLTFKSLPANESLLTTIKITKVKISDLDLPDDMKPYGEYAYDITTGMANGTFDYDLTLPKPNNQNVDVAYMEDKNSTPSTIVESQTAQEGDKVKATSIDHFTIFVVINPVLTGPLCVSAGATSGTDCYSTIQGAINAATNGDTIEIESDISIGQMVVVNKDVTINGNSFIVSPTFAKTDNSNNAAFGIFSSGVTISNLIIDGALGTNLHGINIYMVNNVLLDDVSVLNNDYAGIVVNGSIVTVNNITTSGNGWGGINVDQGSGVTTEARLTVNGLSSHTEAAHIWIDDHRKIVSVVDTLNQYNITNNQQARIYTLIVSTSGNPSATLSQYANDAPTGWVNGNLGASKATYYEGNSVPYRMVMDNLSLASHSLTIEWDTTKSSKHAEDYLTSFNRTVTTADPCIGVSGCSTSTTFPIPIDPQVSGASVTQIAGNFNLYGGTITSVSAYSYADGTGFIGDKSARITITFTASVPNPVLAWGGHIADRKDWGTDNSAISIPGSPYHMRLIDLDGSGGNQDRSLSADAVIFPASITVIKDATPNGSTSFPFTASPLPLTGFSLVDDGTTANISTFSGIVNFQTYTVTENTPSGWSLDGVVCSVTSPNGGTQNVNGATATINLKEGENVSCTYTNSIQYGTLTVQKTTIPAADPTIFSINATGNGTITGGGAGSISDLADQSYIVTPGTYYVSETVPTGWSKTGDTCQGVVVAAGGTSSCTITNTKLGKIIVEKQTLPDGSGQPFGFTASYDADGFSLTDGLQNDSGFLSPGGYSVSETVPDGWTQTSTTCDKGETPENLDVEPGETVTCVFTNTQRGIISGYKYEDRDGDGVNDPDWTPVTGWVIELWQNQQKVTQTTTNGSGFYSFTNLVNGAYQLIEQVLAGWTKISPSSGTINVALSPGENDTGNNFVNTRYGTIIIEKQTIPNGNSEVFDFDTNFGTKDADLSDGQQSTTSGLLPGSYSITETAKTGWQPTDTTCTSSKGDTETATNLELDSGETITCTFTNTKYGYMQGRKYSDTNMDGRLENTETFLDGWTIRLYGSDWQFISSQVTGNNGLLQGQYRFDNLLPGTYYACEVLQGEYQQTGPKLGAHAVDYNNNQVNSSTAVSNDSRATDEAPVCWQSNINGSEFGWLGFGNIQKGHIIIDKVTDPAGDTQKFTFDPTWSQANFVLTDQGTPVNSGPLMPDVYSITELAQNGWSLESATCSDKSPISSISLQPGEVVTCTFTNLKLNPVISIVKSNNSGSGIGAGATVTYTLTVANDGNIDLHNIDVFDYIPGGFAYVIGTTTGDITTDPLVSPSGNLTWNYPETLGIGKSITFSYQVKTNSNLANGTYTNYATCQGLLGRSIEDLARLQQESEPVLCNTDDSGVTINNSLTYGGNLVGQVLGASTELPATGSPTMMLVASLTLIGSGLILNGFGKRERRIHEK